MGQAASPLRQFGSAANSATATMAPAARSFGAASLAPAEPARRFGATATATGHFAHAEAGFGHGPPERVASGRTYLYHGHAYAPFRAAHYDWPHGYAYRRYDVGYRVPRVFWVHQYYVTNYVDYGVEPPPGGFQWIRYGPDLLLIDLSTGQVANSIPGVFQEEDPSQEAVSDQSQGQEQPQ